MVSLIAMQITCCGVWQRFYKNLQNSVPDRQVDSQWGLTIPVYDPCPN